MFSWLAGLEEANHEHFETIFYYVLSYLINISAPEENIILLQIVSTPPSVLLVC